MKTILLIDDHPIVAVGLGLAVGDRDGFMLIGDAKTPEQGLAVVADKNPDAVILDLVFDGIVHRSLVPKCRALRPNAAIVVFSSLSQRIYAKETIAAGADDYLAKSADMPTLLACLAAVFEKRALPSGSISGQADPSERLSVSNTASGDLGSVARIVQGDIHLTSRESQIAARIARGLSVSVIAEDLGISANTVAVHRDNLRKKLGCRDMRELVACLARMDNGLGAP